MDAQVNITPSTGLRPVGQYVHPTLSESDRARFWENVERGAPDACWPWRGAKFSGRAAGYGMFSHDGLKYAHRVAWSIARGPIPKGLSVLHHCDNRPCCNPAHLFTGTHTDNMRDAASKGRLSVPRPSNHKVTTAQLAEIDELLASGMKQYEIAAKFGVTKTWVSLYANGKRRSLDRPKKKRAAA